MQGAASYEAAPYIFIEKSYACTGDAAEGEKAQKQRADEGIGPYECQALYGAWQYVRLFRHSLL